MCLLSPRYVCYMCIVVLFLLVSCFFFLFFIFYFFFFFQAEDGIRDLVRSRGLGDVYKRQEVDLLPNEVGEQIILNSVLLFVDENEVKVGTPDVAGVKLSTTCLLYTSDAADERSSVDLGGRRIIKKKNTINLRQSD